MKEQDLIPAVMKKFFFVKKKTFPACGFCRSNKKTPLVQGAPNENIVQNHFNIALLNVF